MTEGVEPVTRASVEGDIATWRALLGETVEAVGDRNHARWLCEVASSTDGDDFTSVLDEPATERMVAHLDEMLIRYRSGEPLQYVLGCWSFRHLDIAIDRRALIPRPETELVAGAAIEIAREFGPSRTIVDLGTGSGVIGLSLADELPRDFFERLDLNRFAPRLTQVGRILSRLYRRDRWRERSNGWAPRERPERVALEIAVDRVLGRA